IRKYRTETLQLLLISIDFSFYIYICNPSLKILRNQTGTFFKSKFYLIYTFSFCTIFSILLMSSSDNLSCASVIFSFKRANLVVPGIAIYSGFLFIIQAKANCAGVMFLAVARAENEAKID